MRVVLFLNLLLEIVKYILAGEAVFNISLIKRYRVGLFAALSMTILALCINDRDFIIYGYTYYFCYLIYNNGWKPVEQGDLFCKTDFFDSLHGLCY